MTVANVNVTKVLFKRGNTVQNNNYTGVSGEITIDTQAKTLRIHDGSTVGGNIITATLTGNAGSQQAAIDSLNANVGAYQIYANANAATQTVSINAINANLGAFQTFSNANAAAQATSINSINANLGAFQSYANITLSTIANAASQESAINSINANVGAYQTFANSNASSQTTEINSLRANITAANSAITSLTSNAAIQAALLDTLTGNAATQSTVLDTLTANAATQATTLTTLLSNAVAQQTSLIDLVANAATQAQAIANVTGTYSNTNVAAYLGAFDGNILPSANVTYSLGSEQFQWRDLWVSNNTIYIGNTPIRVDGSTLLVNGAPVSGDTYSNTNVAAYLLGNITTGNIESGNLAATGNIVTNVRHWDSAGANLYVWFSAASTPELVTLGTFGNIAGWTVSVSDGNSATVTETNPAGYFSISTDAGLTGSGSLTFTSPDYQSETPAPLTISSGSSTWTFETDGDLIIPRDIFGTGTNSLVIQNTSSGSAYLELPISPSTNAVYLANQDPTGNVVLRTGDFGSEHDWTFGYNGRLNLPGNVTNGYSEIQFVANSSGDGAGFDTIRLVPYTAGYDSAYIVIDPTYPNHIHIRAGGEQDNSPAQLFLGGENSYVSIDSGLDPNVYVRSNNNNWTFGTDGNLTVPGNIAMGPGSGRLISVVTPEPGLVSWEFGMDGNLTIPGNINYANGTSVLSGLGGGGNYGNTEVIALLAANVGMIASTGNLTLRTLSPVTTASVTQEGGTPGGPGAPTVTAQSLYSPDLAIIQVGWTVTGNNLVGTTTVTLVDEYSPGFFEITTDTAETNPFWYNDVYTFTSNAPAYSNVVLSGGNITLPGGGSIDGSDYDVDITAGNDGASTFGHISFTANGPNGLNSFTYNSLGEITVSTAGANDGLIKWVGNSSGDGGGYTTMTMVPDTTREGTDQYIILDPTAPGHIHIRAGGTQDDSGADLILGGENSHVKVTAGLDPPVYIRANSASWVFGTDSSLSMPTGGNLYFDSSATSVIDGVTNINALGTIGANVIQVLSDLTSFGASPAPVIYGFRSISTTGYAVNEGNISASGNLVASQNAYVTGNVFAARYNYANGVSISTSIQNGTSNVGILSSGGLVSVNVGGVANIALFTTTGASIGGTLSVSGFTATGAVTLATASGNINLGSSQTTGHVIVGGPSQTGTILIGQSTYPQTINIGHGVTGSGNTKTIQIGENGAAGSTTLIDIGPATASANGTVTFNTATVVNIANTGGSALSVAGTITGGNVTATGNLTIAGNVTQQSAYYETYANVTNSGGNLTCNFVNGATFYATLTANVTVNFVNVVATAGQVTGATIIVDQGATAYSVANIQINGGGVQTVKWAGGTTNTGTASNTDVMSFSLISLDGTSWRILGQIANYA